MNVKSRSLAALVMTASSLAVACAEKAVAPAIALSPRFTIQVTTTARRTADAQKLLIFAAYLTPPGIGQDPGDSVYIFDLALVDVSGGPQQVNLKVDLTTCLADPTRRGSRDACSMYIGAFLEPATFDPDTNDFFGGASDYQLVGPFDASPGHPPTPPSIDLSTSRFVVNHWEADESLRLGGALTPTIFTGPITGAVSGTGPPTLFALTQGGQATTSPNAPGSYGSILGVYQNGSWRRVNGVPGMPFFADVAAFAANDVYLAANDGVGLYHYDGTAITPAPGLRDQLRSVAVSNASPNVRYLIAGTNSGGVWVGNLTTFTKYSIPGLTTVDAVCINGPTEAFATSRTTAASVYRFDGTSWTSVQTPSTSGKADLQCLGPGQVYVATQGTPGTLYRWNGSGWTALVGPPGTTGRSMNWSVVSANEIYAVGDSASTNRAFYRFDGTSWREVGRLSYTNPAGSGAANRVWADPRGGASYVSSTFVGAAARIDVVTPTSASVATYQPWLRDVAMPTPASAFVVGANFFLARWNAGRWNVDAPPAGTRTTRTLNGVWGADPANVWAVGQHSTIVRWDGARWNVLSDSTRPIVSPSGNYNAAWGAGGSVWIVGDVSIVRCQTATPCAVDQLGAGPLYGVWGTSATNVYAVGAGGKIVHFDGTSWRPMASPTSARLSRVAGSSASDVWAAGDTVMLHFDGSAWKVVRVADDVPFSGYQSQPFVQVGLWAASAREVYYGFWNGRMLRGGGPNWGENPFAFQGYAKVLGISGAPGGCALAIVDPGWSPTAGVSNLLRGVGPTGCLATPMAAPLSWP